MGINKVTMMGNITRAPELRYTTAGNAMAKTAMAVNRKYKGADGTQKEDVLFIDLIFFGRTAEIAHQYLDKGSKTLIEGLLLFEQWTAANHEKRSKHSISVEKLHLL